VTTCVITLVFYSFLVRGKGVAEFSKLRRVNDTVIN
jgi:hypothetical protein